MTRSPFRAPLTILLLVFSCSTLVGTLPAQDPAPADDPEALVEALVQAATEGDLAAVRRLVEAGAPIDGSDRTKQRPLLYAADRSHHEIVEFLLEAGANPNAKGWLETTTLHKAASRPNLAILDRLLAAGAEVNAIEKYQGNSTPLGAAASGGHLENAKRLVAAGADLELGGLSPLIGATRSGRPAMIAYLVSAGADVERGDPPPLHWAKSAESVRALLAAGADPKARKQRDTLGSGSTGGTALHLTTGHWAPEPEGLRLIIDAGGDLSAVDSTGATPLLRAVEWGSPEVVALYLSRGAAVDAKDENGNTPLSLARERGEPFVSLVEDAGAQDDGLPPLLTAAREGDLATVEAELAAGTSPDLTGPRRVTALHFAAEFGHADILRRLLDAGAQVDPTEANRLRPLHLVANAACARTLLEGGASTDTTERFSPLYTAVARGLPEVTRLLIDADEVGGWREQRTPPLLSWAAFFGQVEVVDVLIERGGFVGDEGVQRPLSVAVKGGLGDMACPESVTPEKRTAIVRKLLEAGADPKRTSSWAGHTKEVTLLHDAAGSPVPEIITILLEKGLDPNARLAGFHVGITPLHWVARSGDVESARRLLDAQAEVNAVATSERRRRTPLDFAESEAMRALLVARGGVPAADLGE